ncbi:MAG TPA: peptide deformylase [bacterium]|nr:peptide deformylase [bacterium]HPP29546.1 peptide deformylase [bacterium]
MRKIRIYGEDVLKKKAGEVKNIDDKIEKLIKSMKQTLQKAQGLGLAAPQVGISKRVFIALDKDSDRIITVINPEILKISEDSEIDMEGCLSFPEIYFAIQRAKKVVLKAYDEKGKEFFIEADGLLARCFQHEMDHLNGRLIIDYATEEEKKFWKEKLSRLLKSS